MKLGIISDIHSNLEALTATLTRLEQEHCDELYCLGDIVGYGASPAECLKIVQTNNIKCVLGNHDEYMTSFMPSDFNHLREDVRKSIFWTQQHLTFDDMDWFLRLPMQREEHGVTLIHASFAPRRWSYCTDEKSFSLNFQHQNAQLAFCGHSHNPTVGVEISPGETPYVDNIHSPFIVPDRVKVMINVGSVGQPRDNDPRACAVTYDTGSRELNLLRIEYDVAAAQEKIFKTELPVIFGRRLALGR